MGFREGAFATVWEIRETGNRLSKVRLSTSRKDKKTDEYVTDFNGFVNLIGEANDKLNIIEEALDNGSRCRIKLGACDVTNKYDADAGREYVNYAVFDFEPADSGSSGGGKGSSRKQASKSAKSKPAKQQHPALDDDEEEDLPF